MTRRIWRITPPRTWVSFLFVAVAVALSTPVAAQNEDQANDGLLRAFLDCQFGCDFNHIRRELSFVTWVRDREDADIQLLVTIEFTGSGGRSYALDYIGLRAFDGTEARLVFNSGATDTNDERRDGLTRTIALGLVQYVAQTPTASRLRVDVLGPAESQPTAPSDDPWDFWVFRLSGNGGFEGEERAKSFNVRGEISANRTTENLKLQFEANGFFRRRDFEIDDTTTSVNKTNSLGIEAGGVWSLGAHWSAGGEIELDHSTFRNIDWEATLGPALEFSIFPYEVSTRRELTMFYQLGVRHSNYIDETLFGETSETRPIHQFRTTLSAQEPWGAARASIEWDQFLHDVDKHRLEFSGRLSFRVFRGLDFTVSGSVARVQNQISLPRDDATEEEVLLRLRELGTDFEYRTSFGLSYRFGSIFNNVVNTRF